MATFVAETDPAPKRLIGIFGGTFDPVHNGHLRMAQEIVDAAPMTELRFVPCHVPPHRETPRASASERVELLRAALSEGDPRFRIDTRELEREGPSYMVDTLGSLREELGEKTAIALILGHDALMGLSTWSRWTELTELAHLIILPRPGYRPELPEVLSAHLKNRISEDPQHLLTSPHGSVVPITTSQLEISASQIRELLKRHQSARYLLPEPVLQRIHSLGLYAST